MSGEAAVEAMRPRSRNPYWHGPLCADTLDEIAARMGEVLGGHYFTLVTCNSYDENSDRFTSVEVYPSQFLTSPIDTKQDNWTYLGWATPRLSMGVHTRAKTRADGHGAGVHDRVHFVFEGRQVEIDHFAPAGYRLRWVFAVEHHDPDDPVYAPESPAS